MFVCVGGGEGEGDGWFVAFFTSLQHRLGDNRGDRLGDRIAGLEVKPSAPGAEDPGFESRLRRDVSWSIHTSDLKIGTSVATPPGAWRYNGSAGTGVVIL